MTSGICPNCGTLTQFSNQPPLSRIKCGKCGEELIVPLIFGNFQLTNLIEKNSIIKKYKGHNLNTDQDFLVTILNKRFSGFRECRNLCRKESKDLYFILKHPGIIPILEYGDIEDTFFLTEPYAEYYKLSDYDPEKLGEFEADSVFHAFKTIASILREAHNKGFVHHNICPDNILIDSDGNVKIQDFFINRVTYNYESENDSDFSVSPYYISPEKVEKNCEEEKGDIFSLGVMLFYILTGKYPFDGDNDNSIIYSRIKRPKLSTNANHGVQYKEPVSIDSIRKDIAPEYAELINSMLQPYPIKRPTAAKIVTMLNLIEATIEKRKKLKIYSGAGTGAKKQIKTGISSDLQKALKNHELILHYQPIVNMKQNKIVGLEAFLRWITPVGTIPPANFIPEAEKSDLIHSLGEWAIDSACSQLSEWIKLGFNKLYVTVNISPSQIEKEGFENTYSEILQKHSIDYQQVEFEISQPPSSIPANISLEQYTDFAKLFNSRVSIAELGTKYASLKQQLSSLRLHSLKIDGDYIEDIRKAKKELSAFNSIIALANFLSVPTVAEKVENKKQMNFLLKIGCSLAQGFYFYHPMPAEDVTALLLKEK
jgi:EAL domain-containing protein (putative c-di-GMP-specific phosphodiesterase class I)